MGMLIFLFNHTWVWVLFVLCMWHILFCFSKIDSRILQLEARHWNTRSNEVSCRIHFDFYEMRVTAGILDSVSTSSPYLRCAFSTVWPGTQVPKFHSLKIFSRDSCSPGLQHTFPSALALHSKSTWEPTEPWHTINFRHMFQSSPEKGWVVTRSNPFLTVPSVKQAENGQVLPFYYL